jgi:hypothetical protein
VDAGFADAPGTLDRAREQHLDLLPGLEIRAGGGAEQEVSGIIVEVVPARILLGTPPLHVLLPEFAGIIRVEDFGSEGQAEVRRDRVASSATFRTGMIGKERCGG